MYSLKLAHLVKEHTDAEVYNFYIDIRAPGKGFEEFYDRVAEEGIHFIRGSVAEVTDWALTGRRGQAGDPGRGHAVGLVRRIPVDMVVLAVGPGAAGRCAGGAPAVQHQLLDRRLLPGAPSQAGAGEHLHRRRLPGRLLPGAEGHPRHRGPGRRRRRRGAGAD